jgi:hypothetical protein
MIEIIRDQSDENIIVARVATTVGTILVMAEVELAGRSLILSGMHIQGDDVRVNEVGVAGAPRGDAANAPRGDGGTRCR